MIITAAESRKIAEERISDLVETDLEICRRAIELARNRGDFSIIVGLRMLRPEVETILGNLGYVLSLCKDMEDDLDGEVFTVAGHGLSPMFRYHLEEHGSVNLTIRW
jgi:hypothetical protein